MEATAVIRERTEGKTVVLTTAYLPPLDYILYIRHAERVLLEAHESYQKQSYRNRAQVAGPNGLENLVVPILQPDGHNTPIKKIIVDGATRWGAQHVGAMQSAYGKSAFRPYYSPEIARCIEQAVGQSLWDFNLQLLQCLLRWFGITTPIAETPRFEKEYGSGFLDLRGEMHPKRPRAASVRYFQGFAHRNGFFPNLSCVDYLFQEGNKLPK